jgi:hypothetical protein
MVSKTLDEHIEITPNIMGGKPRIAGHRISVQDIDVLTAQQAGMLDVGDNSHLQSAAAQGRVIITQRVNPKSEIINLLKEE